MESVGDERGQGAIRRREMPDSRHASSRIPSPVTVAAVWLAMMLLTFCGCSGCRPGSDPLSDSPGAEGERPLDEFESGELELLPTDEMRPAYGVKPGHWSSVRQRLKSNRSDFDGQLETSTVNPSTEAIQNLPYRLTSVRPASLPKGQGKSFELSYFVPHSPTDGRTVWISSHLQNRYGSAVRHTQTQLINRMRAHQTFLVILARNKDQYSYAKTLYSIRPPSSELDVGQIPGDYIPILVSVGASPPLPAWPLMWSSTSYVLWDDYDPTLLSRKQQQSMVDWLHWGGQLIISGPRSLEALRNSFLGEYLPADPSQTRVVTDAQIATLNANWSVRSKNPNVDMTIPISGEVKLERLELKLRQSGRYVPNTADLVAERRVGSGRIVVSSVSLSGRELINWRSFDNFFNACLLRRPSRRFNFSLESGLTCQWNEDVDFALSRVSGYSSDEFVLKSELPTLSMELKPSEATGRRTPGECLVTSQVRYFSRDAATSEMKDGPWRDLAASLRLSGFEFDTHAGIAGWSDVSECGQLARAALTSAAGVTVPDRSLIIWALGIYVFVLVPANWTIFRALGRVEWAWIAVPVIAVIGTAAVARVAQLDMGFARSRAEIAVVETQPNHTRAHVTRYLGLYTSLSSDYRLSFDDESALAAPLSTSRFRQGVMTSTKAAVLERAGQRDAQVQLNGLAVSSNSTEMVHAEQMMDLGGSLRMVETSAGTVDIVNSTGHDLLNVGVLRRRRGRLEFAGLRILKGTTSQRMRLRSVEPDQLRRVWQEVGAPTVSIPEGIEPWKFQKLAANPARLAEGDVRLVAWSDRMMPGLTIQPAASQNKGWTLWVANLKYGDSPAPASDENSPTDFRPEVRDD